MWEDQADLGDAERLWANDWQGSQVCLFAQHQSIVIGQKIYVDGGVFRPKGGAEDLNCEWAYAKWSSAGQKLTRDLDRDVRIYDLSQVSVGTLQGKKVSVPQVATIDRPNSIINTRLGYLWTDPGNRFIYRYGGNWIDPPGTVQDTIENATITALVGFDSQALNTSAVDAWYLPQNATPPSITRLAFGAGARSSDSYVGYYLGGVDDLVGEPHTDDLAAKAMVRNELVIWDGAVNRWINQTVHQREYDRTPFNPGAGGVLINVPIGSKGMLVALGGRGFEGDSARFSLTQIRLYDVRSGEWFTQAAVGDIPVPRNNFCGVVGTARDRSSYNIYIAGGQTGPQQGVDDVYILSIPSFRWFKVHSGDQVPRMYHTCEVVQNQQMAIIGGYSAIDLRQDKCAFDMGGDLRFFDMATLRFSDYNPQSSTYEVPPPVLDVIGGTGSGNALKTEPEAGWTDPYLKQTYLSAAGFEISGPTGPPPDGPLVTATTGNSGTSVASNGRIATIAGGIVGGAAGFTIIAVLLILLWRKLKSPKTHITLLLEKGDRPMPSPSASVPLTGLSSSRSRVGSRARMSDIYSTIPIVHDELFTPPAPKDSPPLPSPPPPPARLELTPRSAGIGNPYFPTDPDSPGGRGVIAARRPPPVLPNSRSRDGLSGLPRIPEVLPFSPIMPTPSNDAPGSQMVRSGGEGRGLTGSNEGGMI
ncbi:MAG: hypothetical protein M1817_004101 [Caeruleum heppii]|nr:MAG: hypothetical protein M1817_004101 [Caeruleum heppii]